MPSIAETHSVLNGRGTVFRYEHTAKGWYYRSWNKATRRYKTKQIPNATTLEEALAGCLDIAILLGSSPDTPVRSYTPPPIKSKGIAISQHIKDYLDGSMRKVGAGLKDEAAHIRRAITLNKHLLGYLNSLDISYANQIEETTFDDYPIYRRGIAKNTLKTELKEIQAFIRHYLVRHKHITNELGLSQTLIPKVRLNEEDLDANPAFSKEGYSIVNRYLRNEWLPKATNKRSEYFRRMYWCFVHLLKCSGCRPSELLAIRLKDITLTNPKRWSESNQAYEDNIKLTLFIRKSKTGRTRDVLCRSNAGEHLLEFRKFQDNYFKTYGYKITANPEMLLFGKPDELMDKCYAYRYLDDVWRHQIINPIIDKIPKNRYSDKPFTLYSLRSTFISGCIDDGLDIYTTASLCGHTVKILERYYHRYDLLKKADEIQAIPYGKTKKPKKEEVSIY
jgi:integrase